MDIRNDLIKQIQNKYFKDEIDCRPEEIIYTFYDFVRIEQDYLLNQIELEKGIAKNSFFKENIFLLFVSVITKIPIIVIGNPGSDKSLSLQILYNSMRGKYSKNKFFQQFPPIMQTSLQGSKLTQPEDIKNIFDKTEKSYII